MNDILKEICKDVDEDIKNFAFADSTQKDGDRFYKNWELMWHPNIAILLQQLIRNMKNELR